jgi:hypothetical protein
MAKKRTDTLAPTWLRHRALLGGEAVLLVALAQEFASRFVQASSLPNWGKVLFIMGVTLGLLGGLVLVLQGMAGKLITKVFEIAPLPGLLMHLGIFAGLFALYSFTYQLPVLR